MANFQHLKASRTRVLNTFPTKDFGNDGDIVISRISGRGVFICTKAGGMWYVANQMQELNRIGKSTTKHLTTNKLTVKDLTNEYIVNNLGNIESKTGEQLVDDLLLPFKNISYKSAYCSLEQYSDKETCESNGGTWYYSENDTHDSISSTAENQLLTIGQTIGNVDAESTLLYDGSVLEIKRNTNYDDNWQTAANDNVLKLSYNSSVSSTLGTDSGGALKVTASNTDLSGTLEISTIAEVGSDTDKFLMSDSGVVKFVTGANLRSYIGAGTGDGDITGVSITTDTGSGSKAEDTAGSADFSILGSNGVGVTNSGTTITAVAVPAEIDHDSLNNFDANEHFTQANITTVGTIGTGVWQGTAIAHAYIGADAIEGDNIADDAVNSEHYTDGSIDTAHIGDDQVTYAKIQNMTNARMLGNNAGSDGIITEMTKANVLTFLNVADGATANAGDVTLAGAQTFTGVKTFNANVKIHGENSRYLYLDDGENVSLTASSGTNLSIAVDGTEQISITDEVIKFEQNHFLIKERASAGSDAAGYGQIWIDDAAPNELAFTDDAGTDIVGIGKYHYETKYIGYNATVSAVYLPMTGYIFERTATTSSNEFLCFIAPYDGVLEKFCFRSEIAQDGTASLRFLEASNDTEVPSSMTFRKDLVIDIADDTFLDYDLTSPTSGSTTLTKGRLYNIYLSMPSASQDTNVTMVFKWDITT